MRLYTLILIFELTNLREMKVRSALQYGLNLGPFKLPKKEAK
ncbi:hypothetical protein [Fusobacterium animalis]